MTASDTSAPPSGPWRRPWRLLRLALIYQLDVIDQARLDVSGGMEPLVASTVFTVCVAPITRSARLQRLYATLDNPPPDHLRRPITINSIAASLDMPFETVRRTVHRLVERNILQLTPRGVIFPAASAMGEGYIRPATARYERTRRLYQDLRAAGTPFPPPDDPEPLPGPPVRLVNRLIGEYGLRVMERVMRWTNDPLRAVMLMQVARASADHLEPEAFDEPDPITNFIPRPVRVSEVARALDIPHETVRRNLRALESASLLKREPAGYLINLEMITEEAARESFRGGIRDFRRFVERLARLGVFAWWDAEDQAAAGVAVRSSEPAL